MLCVSGWLYLRASFPCHLVVSQLAGSWANCHALDSQLCNAWVKLSSAQTALWQIEWWNIAMADPKVWDTPIAMYLDRCFFISSTTCQIGQKALQLLSMIVPDDTTLHTSSKSVALSCTGLSVDLDAAAKWAERWGMLFSVPKSKHLLIGSKTGRSPAILMKGILIPQFPTHQHLGPGVVLELNITITWKDHIESVFSVCLCVCVPWWLGPYDVMIRLGKIISMAALKKNFTATIHPRMVYVCAVWSWSPTSSLQLLQESFCKRYTCSITFAPRDKRYTSHPYHAGFLELN